MTFIDFIFSFLGLKLSQRCKIYLLDLNCPDTTDYKYTKNCPCSQYLGSNCPDTRIQNISKIVNTHNFSKLSILTIHASNSKTHKTNCPNASNRNNIINS